MDRIKQQSVTVCVVTKSFSVPHLAVQMHERRGVTTDHLPATLEHPQAEVALLTLMNQFFRVAPKLQNKLAAHSMCTTDVVPELCPNRSSRDSARPSAAHRFQIG